MSIAAPSVRQNRRRRYAPSSHSLDAGFDRSFRPHPTDFIAEIGGGAGHAGGCVTALTASFSAKLTGLIRRIANELEVGVGDKHRWRRKPVQLDRHPRHARERVRLAAGHNFRSGRSLAVARRPLNGRTPRRPPAICYVRSTVDSGSSPVRHPCHRHQGRACGALAVAAAIAAMRRMKSATRSGTVIGSICPPSTTSK